MVILRQCNERLWQCYDSYEKVMAMSWQWYKAMAMLWQYYKAITMVWQCYKAIAIVWQYYRVMAMLRQCYKTMAMLRRCCKTMAMVWQCYKVMAMLRQCYEKLWQHYDLCYDKADISFVWLNKFLLNHLQRTCKWKVQGYTALCSWHLIILSYNTS